MEKIIELFFTIYQNLKCSKHFSYEFGLVFCHTETKILGFKVA